MRMLYRHTSPRSEVEVQEYLVSFAPLGGEDVSLLEGLEGRTLAQDIDAADTVPLTHCAGLEGYAVRWADVSTASPQNPIFLQCIGTCSAGSIPKSDIQSGQCMYVSIGAILPEGADAIVLPEQAKKHAVEQGTDTTAFSLEICACITFMQNVIARGEDAILNARLLPSSTFLRPQEVALLASTGIKEENINLDNIVHGAVHHTVHVTAHKRPQVALISVGDELVPVYSSVYAGQVRDINSHALAALVREAGGMPRFHGIVPNEEDKITEALERTLLSSAHVIFIAISNGAPWQECLLKALENLPQRHGLEVFCQGVEILPGAELVLLHAGNKSIWILPSHITTIHVLMHVLGQPFLRHLQGIQQPFKQENPIVWKQCYAQLSEDVYSSIQHVEYARVRLEFIEDGLIVAYPVLSLSGSLHTMMASHGLVYIPKDCAKLEKNTTVRVLLFN